MERARRPIWPLRVIERVFPSAVRAGLMLLVASAAGCATTGTPAERQGGQGRAASSALAGNLVQNGDFSAGLAHWELSGRGAVVDDPQQPGNPVLRVELDEDLFGLSQPIAVPAGTERLAIRFRVLATGVDESAAIGLRLRIEDASGDSAFGMWRIARSNTWIEITEDANQLPERPVAVTLENNHGAGALLIDDLVVRPDPASSDATRPAPSP
jgi:hypothetical protein